jgi:hypothetical protein
MTLSRLEVIIDVGGREERRLGRATPHLRRSLRSSGDTAPLSARYPDPFIGGVELREPKTINPVPGWTDYADVTHCTAQCGIGCNSHSSDQGVYDCPQGKVLVGRVVGMVGASVGSKHSLGGNPPPPACNQ